LRVDPPYSGFNGFTNGAHVLNLTSAPKINIISFSTDCASVGLGLEDRALCLRKECYTTPVPEKKRIRRSFRAPEGDWRRVDIHLHTPASADWLDPGITYLQWLQKAESRGLDIVAITDHNTVEGVARLRAEVERLTWLEANDRLRPQERRDLDEYRRLGDKILVLPGFEFTATFGFHILGIFPPETALRKLELLLLRLNVPMDRFSEGVTEVGPTTDVLTAYRVIREAGGLVIAAHANSTHGVALQGMSFGGQTRIAFTQDPNLHALEVTDLESASRRAAWRFFDGSKPEYPRRMHLLQGSDAHRLTRDPKDKNRLGVGDRVTEILLPEVSFDALRVVLEGNDFTLMRPYRPPAEAPFDHVQAALELGPNIIQAFHGSLSRDGGGLQRVLCDVVAFANTSGGTIYVGVTDKNGPRRGLEAPDLAVQLLKKEIERNVTPPLDVTVDILTTQGVPVLRAVVPNGIDKPYALGQTRVYIREESETNEAVRDELVQLVRGSRRYDEAQPQVVEPATVVPAPAETPVTPAAAPALRVPTERSTVRRMPASGRPGQTAESSQEESLTPLPSIGVELVSMEERKGGRYFAIRDLRNGNIVQNVTIHSARKLWSYAINQHLTHADGPDDVTWRGNLGLWQAARRAKKLRYDLALRMPDGKVRVFYGVTADGMTGPWAQFLLEEDRPEGEMETMPPAVIIAEEPEDEREVEMSEPTDILAPPENGEREPEVAVKVRSRRGRRGGRDRSKGVRPAAGDAEAEVGIPSEADALPAPVVESDLPIVAPAESEVPAASKPRSRARKPKAEAAIQPAPDVQAELQEDTAVAVVEIPAPMPRSRSRTRKQPDASAAAATGELAVLASVPDAQAVAAGSSSSKPASAASKRQAPAKPKPQLPEAARSMPEAIGQAPKRRIRKPKQEPAAE